MKNKKTSFKIRRIKKQTFRTHHVALFIVVIALGAIFGLEAAFGASVARPYSNNAYPDPIYTPPASIDAAAPNVPGAPPTGSSTVTPKFSGANLQGYIFNQQAGEPSEANPIELYDNINVWGPLNAMSNIWNTGYLGGSPAQVLSPYIQSSEDWQGYDPPVVIDDLFDVKQGILNTSTGSDTNGFLSLFDAVEIKPFNGTPTIDLQSQNRPFVITNEFGEADIEFVMRSGPGLVPLAPNTWQVGSSQPTDIPYTNFYIKNENGVRLYIDDGYNETMISQNLRVLGNVTAPIIKTGAGGAIGRFYTNSDLNTISENPKEAVASCNAGDTLISCGGMQVGSTYIYRGSQPAGGTSCSAQSYTTGASNINGLYSYAFCFSPDG